MRRLTAVLLVALTLPFTALPAAAADGASVPTGFVDEAIWTGLDHPTAVAFAPNGNVFVAEKRGTIQFYSSLSDTTPTLFADLNANVHNYWDRGLLGLAVDPGFPARPYVYVLYSYNHILGDPASGPRWPSADALVPPGSAYDDRCPNPPGPTSDGCVISGRLSRLTSSGGVMSGPEDVVIEDWCNQFPSHSVGSLMFGPEGALYASAGDGASFNAPDYGQMGGTLANTPTPANPCGDPTGGLPGTPATPPGAEGGALRSQDLRTSGDPVTLDGSIVRIDPDTGLGWPTNALSGNSDVNARRIIGHGLRNPFRFTIRPGTSEVWIGDVGAGSWEEVDRLVDPTAAPANFGWPCWEGKNPQSGFQSYGLAICSQLAAGSVTLPYYTYLHSAAVVSGDGCTTGGSSISGLTFMPAASGYPDAYDGGLFMSDYTRRCIWFVPKGSDGLPDLTQRAIFAKLARPDPITDGSAVFLTNAPNGDLMYVDYDRGEVRTVRFTGAGLPTIARFTATPSIGPAPLDVAFDASSSTGVEPLTYDWDLDGDGQYDDATGPTTTQTYPEIGATTAQLRVTDALERTATTSTAITAGNAPPTVTIDHPDIALTWKVGDTIAFDGSATDAQDGSLPASAFVWTLTMRHCPDDCHSHVIETFTGVTSGSFVAPDHDMPSHLALSVTVTDSNGAKGSAAVDLYPETGSLTIATSPRGILTTAGDTTGESPTETAPLGSVRTVTAPETVVLGEETWTFASWSDGGARTHSVPILTDTDVLTASYTFTKSTDRSGSCSASPAATAPSGSWQLGKFGTAGDVDWYRFKLTSTSRVRIVLGDLPANAKLELYKGCSTRLQTSDRAGLGAEEIIRKLPAGSYAVKIVGNGTTDSPNHALLIKRMSSGVRVLTSRARVEGSTLRLVGEVYNNGTRTVGSVTVTAKIYNAAGKLLTTRSAKVALPYVKVATRAPFTIVGSLPAGYHHVAWSVSSSPTSRRIVSPERTITSAGLDASGHWVVKGTIKNPLTTRITSIGLGITLYDARRSVLDIRKATLSVTSLSGKRSTSFSATFLATGLSPNLTYPRGAGVD